MEKTVFVIAGKREKKRNRLWVSGKELDPEISLAVRNHSPDGFNWGYGGSGPAQSALAICLEIFPEQWMAEALYQSFKWSFVSKWQDDEFSTTIDITDFLIDNRRIFERAKNDHQENY